VRLPGAVASTRFFRVFPARVLAGRTFDPDLPVGTREAVLSERLWRRMFGSDPGIVGKALSFNGESVPVVGVVAAEFAVPPESEVWLTPRFSVPDHPLRPLVYRLARRLFIGVHVAAENGRWFLPTAERTQVRQRHRL